MPHFDIELSPRAFAAMRLAPSELIDEMRVAAAIHWYGQGLVSQGSAAEISAMSRTDFLAELFRRRVSASQITLEELREDLAGG